MWSRWITSSEVFADYRRNSRDVLSRFVYTEIFSRKWHSTKAVKRYLNRFGWVVALYERGLREAGEIAHLVGSSARLVSEYLELYFQVVKKHQIINKNNPEIKRRSQLDGLQSYAEEVYHGY
ncbi:MAG: DUF1670 domain-containing protein [Bacteroidota bacterium]